MSSQPLSSIILGMNARNSRMVKPNNPPEAVQLVKSKIRFKKQLVKAGIDTPAIIDVCASFRDMERIPWGELEGRSFVIKPERGSGGAGIIVLKWSRKRKTWTKGGDDWDQERIRRHVRDILDGQFSANNLPDRAFMEEMVTPYARFFRELSPMGLPDVRVIVFNGIPLMAMVRFPTIQSGGKANLHAGGLGLGVDIGSGTTTTAIHHDQLVAIHPDNAMRLTDLRVPKWRKILETAIETQAASGLGYCGVDIVMDQSGRVLVLEANARPGLAIQLANMAGLAERINRVRNLKVRSLGHGIRIANDLFSESDLVRVRRKGAREEVARIQEIAVARPLGRAETRVEAKMDTGAWGSSISFDVARSIGYERLLEELQDRHIFDAMSYEDAQSFVAQQRESEFFRSRPDVVLKVVKQASGVTVRVNVPVRLTINRRLITTVASIVDRSILRFPVIVGARDLGGFMVYPRRRTVKK